MEQYVTHVLAPYCVRVREQLQLASDQPALCIFDVFRAHRVDSVRDLLRSYNIKMVYVPANCTGELQPLDLSGNQEFKDALKQQFIDWYADKVCETLKPDETTDQPKFDIDLRLSVLKPLHAKWILQAWDKLKNNRAALIRGWEKSGITAAVTGSIADDSQDAVRENRD